ncbi:hypothetical protein [Desulfatitalea alkaliphila]|uniref:Uncharacterized protein n=1 Tax=Desulfatitalea alkaliphila TaxID=2929485 RepID=A0AA41UIZ5_9BACT|nr:hypothetical protein [Desulfatitalea alkaliphila]MCJ8500624.1 hypothetical protein [Desulfatitalea alkaliphila]
MESLWSITPVPLLSLLVWLVLLISAMYLARKPFHRTVYAVGRMVRNAMRVAAASVRLAEKRLQLRNHQVLMREGLDLADRKVALEFARISEDVQRDLEGYPRLQRTVMQDLAKIEEDYAKSAAVPQALPDWVKVIDAIAHIKPSGDRMVINMLEEIHQTLSEQHRAALERHRRDMAERHAILSRMLPFWRGVQRSLGNVEKAIARLTERSNKIDRYMDHFEAVQAQTDPARRHLAASSLTRFFVSALVLAVAAVGAVINFNLVALPMAEMVGGNSFIGSFKTADVAGVFLVALQIVVGFFLMDALRITRLFSVIGHLAERQRKVLFWVLLLFLAVLAGMEASLAFLRDRLVGEMEALRQAVAGEELAPMVESAIPTIGQMIMGFTLPFVLAFVAIPFESFVTSTRALIGGFAAWLLRMTALLLRLTGHLAFYAGRLVVQLYDLAVFPALWLEDALMQKVRQLRSPAPSCQHTKRTDQGGTGSSAGKQAASSRFMD